MNNFDTICSISTPQGIGALAMIRVSGKEAFEIVSKLFKDSKDFKAQPSHLVNRFDIYEDNALIDQVMAVKFFAPKTYTGEDIVEITCHGSHYIQQKIIELLLQNGARLAKAGEFSMRAFLNGKLDLPQAEAIVDLIDSQSEVAHKLAINQLKGNFSARIKALRDQFVELAALMELELDFSEEDVEFADRSRLNQLLHTLKEEVFQLTESFKLGNVLKTGIPVAIIGKPNVGKSTLLNSLLKDDRAIVSHIPGTTRDTIEDNFTINGTNFRFIDTAGIRLTDDEIETFGIERTFKAIDKADIILYMIDISEASLEEVEKELLFLENEIDFIRKKLIIVANKIDQLNELPKHFTEWNKYDIAFISAKRNVNIDDIRELLVKHIEQQKITETTLLTNIRHYDIMLKIEEEINKIETGFAQQLPTDLIVVHINLILNCLGQITGEITNEEVLGAVFSRFCIGK
ncbi:MAG: tRNA uridine-5-carboxymethylaminomethyl(34) synthesis GTPase MnmE [Bacteroidetes bacterium]|nr:tRNA uridine-5-carboxymethylaminomethyl(34) synthesis GTPase MnmE [Bacteroidota bacterium]MCL2303212.1 tRNA uridine-5-carboxymethylaminomethyl(34) synthesis GTPase MnmE [Lentimicrobiaceae bacterium]